MSAVKSGTPEQIEQALCAPTYPRTVRLVMTRNLSVAQYTNGMIESIKPRMKGRDLEVYVLM